MLVFCICAPVFAQKAELGGTAPVAGVARAPAPSNDKTLLNPEERQWLSQLDRRIRIGVTVIPPQVLLVNGEYNGLSIDYIHLIERKLGCRFELVPYATWNEVIVAARTRQIDMIFAAQRTPERLTYLLFTEPYIELPNMILVRKDRKGGASLNEMKGWSIATSEGSAVHEYLKKEFNYLDLRPVHDELRGLIEVSLGEVDAMVVEVSRASYYLEKAGILNLRVAGNAGLLYQLRFAIRSDWPILVGIIDKGLSSITDEERQDIRRRWIIIGGASVFVSRAFWISFIAGLGGVAAAVVGVIVWNQALQRNVRQRTSQLQQELAERKKVEEALHRLNRELRAIRNCTLTLMRAEDEQTLLKEVCHIICDEAGYRMAWVGYAENDDAKTIRPVAWAGAEEGYLQHARPTWADTEQGRGPSGTAIRSGKSACFQDFAVTPEAAPWRDIALQRGYRSSIALPLKDEGANTFGVLNIYSVEPNAFPPGETRLMEELAGDLAFGVMVQRDRTERKKAEAEILKLNQELEMRVADRTARLEAVNKELEAFAYSVSHDLRAPLRAIDGFSNILLEEYMDRLDEDGQRYLNTIRQGAARMGQLIDDILSFSRSSRREIVMVAVNMKALVSEVFDELQAGAPERNICLRLGELPPTRADPAMIRQVLANLLGNAIKYTAKRAEAVIEAGGAIEGAENVYWIKDNGVGFDMNYADKLFGVFQRLHSNEEFEGTGIGLAIVKQIIERHGGRVWAEGKVDEGATVHFTLPAMWSKD